jgi:hypothetical protein
MRPVFLPFPPAPLATTERLCGWFLGNLRLGVHAWGAQRVRQVEGVVRVNLLVAVFSVSTLVPTEHIHFALCGRNVLERMGGFS